MSQRTLMASEGGQWTQHDLSQEAKSPLIQLFRSSFRGLTLKSLLGRDAPSHASSRYRMDGISEGSPLAGVIQAWDCVEGFIEDYPSLPFALCILCAYLSFCRSLKNTGLVLGFLGWLKRKSIQSTLHGLLPPSTIPRALALAVPTWLCVKLFLPWLSSDGAPNHDGPSRPYLIPSRTTHTRLVPKKHSFDYSYLLVGVPVGWKGNSNGMISVDACKRPKALGSSSAWYNVESVEYLERGAGHLGLRGKLDNFLRSQNVNPSSYPHAYFITAPRFLGYSFNPVSFWYLYSGDKVLSAIVLEVNNTFGERRSYLVTRDFDNEAKHLQNATLTAQGGDIPRARVKNTWAKDFHVSPFNSRNGTYSVMAADPLGEGMKGFRGLDVTISLSSSQGQSKIIARLFSDGEATDPSSMNVFQKLIFLSSWFWVGFVTVPRIVAEASKLFFKRKLHVWYRPEPLKESLGRTADNNEIILEAAFRAYLRSLAEKSPSPLRVIYMPSGILERTEETFESPNVKVRSSEVEEVRFKVLTPAFYARFIHYAHDVEAVFCEMAESCTLWIDKPDVLPKIFVKKPLAPLHATSLLDFASFKLIKALRRRPETIKRPLTSAETTLEAPRASDIRDFRMSSMDAFVFAQENLQLKKDYRSAALVLFVADRFFFGWVVLLDMVVLIGKVGVAWTVASILARASRSS